MDHLRDRHVAGGGRLAVRDGDDVHPVGHVPVDVHELVVERAVVGGDDQLVALAVGVERPDDGVVVHHVAVAHRVVRVDHVPQLDDARADLRGLRARVDDLLGTGQCCRPS
jgi:hypothetical protein